MIYIFTNNIFIINRIKYIHSFQIKYFIVVYHFKDNSQNKQCTNIVEKKFFVCFVNTIIVLSHKS